MPVTPRLVQGDIIVVTEGLEAGSRVLVVPPTPAIEGMLLEPHPDTDLMARLSADGPAE